ncbi:hypothetical protein F4818DRAFT_244104 [Hypoxylon cercidicola]|nr:hypothetical protein F4818DRAFT_244104 [Hypoxylon cercidicola]
MARCRFYICLPFGLQFHFILIMSDVIVVSNLWRKRIHMVHLCDSFEMKGEWLVSPPNTYWTRYRRTPSTNSAVFHIARTTCVYALLNLVSSVLVVICPILHGPSSDLFGLHLVHCQNDSDQDDECSIVLQVTAPVFPIWVSQGF